VASRSGGRQALQAKANDNEASEVIHAMRSTITARGQTVVPAPIRERFGLGPSTLLEQAAAIKANHRLSVADAWIAAAAPILIPCLPC
jgi:hypothetical protein